MEMELISREFIKPSTPTPPHHKIHPLSFIDQIVARSYVPIVYFYPNELPSQNEYDNNQLESKISILKKSLSKLLSIYYPFAGRFRDQVSIDCNDEGVSLLVTRIKSNLSEILQNPNEALLNPLFPDELQWKVMEDSNPSAITSIVAIQINCFACGGIAISVCMSHKVGDGSTLFHFVNDWATMNRATATSSTPSFPYYKKIFGYFFSPNYKEYKPPKFAWRGSSVPSPLFM